MSIIAIDPGHGGENRGTALGTTYEKEVTLLLAAELSQACAGIPGVTDVFLTREIDDEPGWVQRGRFVEAADLFVSLHVNYSSNPAHDGPEGYYLNADDVGHRMAIAFVEGMVLGQWAKRTRVHPAEQAALPGSQGGRGTPAPLNVLRVYQSKPGFLAETLYSSNDADSKRLLSSMERSIIVCALRRSIVVGLIALQEKSK